MAITVFLVGDHHSIRSLLRVLLEMHNDFVIAGDASSGEDAARTVAHCRPDVVVLDLIPPMHQSLAVVREMLSLCPGIRIVALSLYASKEHLQRARAAGVYGFVLKERAGDELAVAIRTVHDGKYFLSPKIVD